MSERQSPIGAYVVTGYDGEHSAIVYARNPMEARRLGNNEIGNGDDERFCEVVRSPEWDDGYDTRALLDAGWHWECGSCYKPCWGDDLHVLVRDDVAYCSIACCIKSLRKEREERATIWQGLESIARRAPGARVERIYQNIFGDVIAEIQRPGNDFTTVERFERSEHEETKSA